MEVPSSSLGVPTTSGDKMNFRTITTNYSPYIDTGATTTSGSFTMNDGWSNVSVNGQNPPWITITTPSDTGDALERLRGMRERRSGGLAVAS